ncbi:hypothetical protein GCM10009785_26570 [Brooklawnia cerclae]|uniref:Uncharacterized protein n=1 Tax=Brooklawnia cerclae TaxID=349934 RepID=A0ABX0SKS7_9ACTN|nr:hypothetical protein [Brooklawnia cerclae]NIH57337.1 hypothetical protein [Brooklawnia cerclae]
MTTTTATITWTKLRSGSWGIKGHGLVSGETVTVTKRSGETKSATVGKVLWTSDDGVSIATVASSTASRTSHSASQHGGTCDECGRYSRNLVLAYDLSGIAGDVCPRCKREEGTLSFC